MKDNIPLRFHNGDNLSRLDPGNLDAYGGKKGRANATSKMPKSALWRVSGVVLRVPLSMPKWLPDRIFRSRVVSLYEVGENAHVGNVQWKAHESLDMNIAWHVQVWYLFTPAPPTQSQVPSRGSSQSHSQQLARRRPVRSQQWRPWRGKEMLRVP